MNTNDPAGLPAGFPDVETLTRLANQFFSETPGGTAPEVPRDFGPPIPSATALPFEAELVELLSSLPSKPLTPAR